MQTGVEIGGYRILDYVMDFHIHAVQFNTRNYFPGAKTLIMFEYP